MTSRAPRSAPEPEASPRRSSGVGAPARSEPHPLAPKHSYEHFEAPPYRPKPRRPFAPPLKLGGQHADQVAFSKTGFGCVRLSLTFKGVTQSYLSFQSCRQEGLR